MNFIIGKGRIHLRPGGGGADDILLNNAGPTGGEGEGPGGADEGISYGAGGGSGFTSVDEDEDDNSNGIFYAGGKGADSLVYVEWSDVERRI